MCVWCAAGSVCAVQPAPSAVPPTATTPVPTAQGVTHATLPPVEAVAARALTRIALSDLKLVKSPGEADFIVASALLALACELQPLDEDMLRLYIEAASSAGDRAGLEDATRRLLKLDPGDTVAQLGLLSANISRLQDVDARERAYAQLLGPQGQALDASVRSRLALDLALLLRERGDAAGFAERLKQATVLDPTNKDAAGLLVMFVSSRGGGDAPEKRLEALLILLGADPLDPEVHLAIARELAAAGAWKPALRFFTNTEAILNKIGERMGAEVALEMRVARWMSEGPGVVAKELADSIGKPRRQVKESAEALKAQGREADIAKLPNVADIKLSPDAERVLALSASAGGDTALLKLALDEMTDTLARMEKAREDPTARPKEWTPQMAVDASVQQLVSVAWTRLLVESDAAEAGKLLGKAKGLAALPADVSARLEGLFAVRLGDEAGMARLTDAAARDPLAALALAAAQEARGQRDDAAKGFAQSAVILRGTATGAWAETKARTLGSPVKVSEGARLMGALADGVPRWIDGMHLRAQAFQALTAALAATSGGPLDKAMIEVSLRNSAPIPLAVGPDKPLNSRIMFGPSIDIGTRRVSGTSPEVVSLERRLRLMPGEELKVKVWADPGYNGFLSELSAGELSRIRWRVVQGFRLNDTGTAEAGPLSLSTETGMYMKQTYPRPTEPLPALALAIAAATPAELSGLLGTVRWRFFLDEGGVARLLPAEQTLVVNVLIERYAKGDANERLAMLSVLPTGRLLKALAPLDKAMFEATETDPRVALVKIATRIAEPGDAMLAAALASSDPKLAALAAATKQRLQGDARTYSRFTLFGK